MKRLVVGFAAFLSLAAVPAVAGDYCIMANDLCPVAPSDLEQCHESCMGAYLAQAIVCRVLPPPWNAICHGENSMSLAQCMRDCR
jgi:hypothetical protein